MKNWFKRGGLEKRDSSYTDALVSAITLGASGKASAFPTATAALESCAGFIGRSFAGAVVKSDSGISKILTPTLLSMAGRALVRRGEIVFYIRADMDGVALLPCESFDITGGPDPESWLYRCVLGGPARTHTFDKVTSEGVVHLTYARDPARPWRGLSPLYAASLAGRLSAETAAALADEASGPRGSFLPVPVDGEDDTVAGMTANIDRARGRMLLAEGGDWDNIASGASARYDQKRFGANPPSAMVELHKLASMEIYSACGVSPLIFAAGQGTAAREGYRQTLFTTIAPLGRLVETELRAKLDDPSISIAWDELRAADITGRARAFQSLVGAGMDLDRAAALSGLLAPDEA